MLKHVSFGIAAGVIALGGIRKVRSVAIVEKFPKIVKTRGVLWGTEPLAFGKRHLVTHRDDSG